MVVSTAFEELSALLARFEAADTDVHSVAVQEQEVGADRTLTADLVVSVPLLAGPAVRDGITIEAESADVEAQCVSLELTLTVPVADDGSAVAPDRTSSRPDSPAEADETPAYKDPEALAAAYAEYDTFPEMTAALNADVTPETVRRHAIKHGIHDPNDSTLQLGQRDSPNTQRSTAPRANGTGDDPDLDERVAVAESSGESSRSATRDDESSVSNTVSADRPIAELLSKTSEDGRENTVVTDGVGVPSELTVGQVTGAINQSRTVHEAQTHLGMDRESTRQLLQQFDLLSFVSHPLATDPIEIAPKELLRRIDSDGD